MNDQPPSNFLPLDRYTFPPFFIPFSPEQRRYPNSLSETRAEGRQLEDTLLTRSHYDAACLLFCTSSTCFSFYCPYLAIVTFFRLLRTYMSMDDFVALDSGNLMVTTVISGNDRAMSRIS